MAIAISRNTTFIYVNRMFTNMFGYSSSEELIGRPIGDMVAEQDAPVFINRARKREEGADVENQYETTGLRPDGSRFPITGAVARVNLPDGPASIGFFQDITSHRNAEEALEKTVMEKEILLKELHHRVKNNLNVVSSLLGLEMEKLADEGARQVFTNALSRINSMAVIYEQLNRTSKLAEVNLGLYIMDLAELTFKTYAQDPQCIHLETRTVDMELDIKRAVPLGIILNELVSNAIKSAYPPGVKGTIRIDLENTGGRITLRVSDDGPGFPPGFDPEITDTLGLKLVSTLAKQIDADLTIKNGKGATVEVAFTL
ncbi:MAG: PAS domain S-box protein [Spirochaetes bacterium]|nr:PAS domain S-box protein [Spirochaetota bacterium]